MLFKRTGILFILALSLLAACNNEKSCLEERVTYVKISFQEVYETFGLKRVKDSSLTKLVIKWPGYTTDTIKKVTSIKLPLSQNADTSVFECTINDNPTDTIYFTYTRNQVFINYDCGFRTDFNLDTLVSVNNRFDSIQIVRPIVTNADETHIKIYLPNITSTSRTR